MKITQQQYEKIADSSPRQRGNVTIDCLTMLNAMLHVLEHGCKWRGIPSRFGNWRSICARMSRCRIFTRFDKLDVMFMGFIVFALIVTAIK